MRRFISVSCLALLLAACASAPARLPRGRVVDLSHVFDAETIFWPTEEGFVLERGSAGITAGGYYYEAHRFRTAEHGGTHIDAPIHFGEGQRTVDEIPLSRLMGEAVVVGQNDGNNRLVRIRAHRKLCGAGSDRCVAGIDAEEADDRGVVSRSHSSVVTDRFWACVLRVGASPGLPEPAAQAQAPSR